MRASTTILIVGVECFFGFSTTSDNHSNIGSAAGV